MVGMKKYILVDQFGNPLRIYDPLECLIRSSGNPLLIALADALMNAGQQALDAYRPAKECLGPWAKDNAALRRILARESWIRTRKPSPQRLLVHEGDWREYLRRQGAGWMDDLPAPLADQVLTEVRERESRKVQERRRRGKG
jgi:hypothetical protein